MLANGPQLTSDLKLAQAIAVLEQRLSEEERATFRTIKAQTLRKYPTRNDVMLLVAELNRQTASMLLNECPGPRFMDFLHAVQQFAASGEIVLGGPANLSACGVWALVRLTLLSAVRYPSFFTCLSISFRQTGLYAVHDQALPMIYSMSRLLQSQVREYFITVVGVCGLILKDLKPRIQKSERSECVWAEEQLDSCRKRLEQLALSIEQESINAQTRSPNSSSLKRRTSLGKSSKAVACQQTLSQKQQILDLCSQHDHEAAWKSYRELGTSTVHEHSMSYQYWKSATESRTLAVVGHAGSGKSVLLANLVDDLYLSQGYGIAYYFCQKGDPEGRCSRAVFGSIASQLLRTLPGQQEIDAARLWGSNKPSADTTTIRQLLLRNLPRSLKFFIVLDGLEDCDTTQVRLLAAEIQALQKQLNLCIAVSASKSQGLPAIFKNGHDLQGLKMPANNPDVGTFLEGKLQSHLESGALVVVDGVLKNHIYRTLTRRSQGNFKWVAHQLKLLCEAATDQEVLDHLASLPEDLEQPLEHSNLLQRQAESCGKPGSQIVSTAQGATTATPSPETLNRQLHRLDSVMEEPELTCATRLTVHEAAKSAKAFHQNVEVTL